MKPRDMPHLSGLVLLALSLLLTVGAVIALARFADTGLFFWIAGGAFCLLVLLPVADACLARR